MKIPCEDCLVLAACKNKESIDCNELYKWVIKDEGNGEHKDSGLRKYFKTKWNYVYTVNPKMNSGQGRVVFIEFVSSETVRRLL